MVNESDSRGSRNVQFFLRESDNIESVRIVSRFDFLSILIGNQDGLRRGASNGEGTTVHDGYFVTDFMLPFQLVSPLVLNQYPNVGIGIDRIIAPDGRRREGTDDDRGGLG